MLLIPDAKTSPPLGVGDAKPRDILDADESNINRRESRAILKCVLVYFSPLPASTTFCACLTIFVRPPLAKSSHPSV